MAVPQPMRQNWTAVQQAAIRHLANRRMIITAPPIVTQGPIVPLEGVGLTASVGTGPPTVEPRLGGRRVVINRNAAVWMATWMMAGGWVGHLVHHEVLGTVAGIAWGWFRWNPKP